MSFIMDNKRVEQLTMGIGVISLAIGAIQAVCILNRQYQDNKKLPPLVPYKYPFIGSTFDFYKDPVEYTISKTKEYGSVFRMHLHGDVVAVIGSEDALEVFNHPDLSFPKSQTKFYDAVKFNDSADDLFTDNSIRNFIIKILTPNLKMYAERSFEEFLKYTDKKITENEFEVPNILPFVRQFIAKYSATAFVGPEMGSNQDLLYVFENIAVDVIEDMKVTPLRLIFPLWNTLYMKYFTPKAESITKHRALIKQVIKQEIERRLQEPEKEYDDLLGYLRKLNPQETLDDHYLESVTTILVVFVFVSVQTTSESATYVLYRLVQNPEYIEQLREEQEDVLAEEGGIYHLDAYRRMERLDSFMHEALRCRLTGIGFPHTNIGLQNIVLRSGVTVKPGQEVYINLWDIHHQENDDFDGSRYIGQKKPLTKPGQDNIVFGMGKRACPGRWFATQQIKGLVTYFVRNYDMYPVGKVNIKNGRSSDVGAPEGVVRFVKRDILNK